MSEGESELTVLRNAAVNLEACGFYTSANRVHEAADTIASLTTQLEAERKASADKDARIAFYKDREEHFAKVFGVCDGGQYREDWGGAAKRMHERATKAEAALREKAMKYLALDQQATEALERAVKVEEERDRLRNAGERYLNAVASLGEKSGYNHLTYFETPILKAPTDEIGDECCRRWAELNDTGKALRAALIAKEESDA